MRNLRLILTALIKNKYRFGENTSGGKRAGMFAAFGALYLVIVSYAILLTVVMGGIMNDMGYAQEFYVLLLTIGAVFVLVFGIIHLVSTLYLSKDTAFFSTLPVKPVTVFAAKLLFVYLSETVIAVAVLLPALVSYGIVINAWFGYYIITVLTALIVPALPLAVAAIIAVPTMFIASKLKHRDIVPLIFYCVLFVGFFAVYIYMIFSLNTDGITDESAARLASAMKVVMYVLYPYLSLARSALGADSFGFGAAGSIAVNLLIFAGISAALIAVLIGLGLLMYGKASAANNQTDASKVKNGAFRSRNSIKSLMHREYVLAFHTTSTAFQCFAAVLLTVAMSVFMSIMMKSSFANLPDEVQIDPGMSVLLVLAIVCAILPSGSNAAATSISREGAGFAMLKTMPLDAKTILKAKIISWGVISVPSAFISAVIVNVFNFDPVLFVLSVIAVTGLSAAITVFEILWDLKAPKLNWTNPMDAIKHNMHVTLGQLIFIGVGMILVFASSAMMLLASYSVAVTVNLLFLYLYLTVLIIVDIFMFKKAETYYNKIEF